MTTMGPPMNYENPRFPEYSGSKQYPESSQYPQSSQYPESRQYPHPSLNQLVTDDQRDKAERFLQEAYADGRLNEYEFDGRLEQVLNARTRQDLNSAFYGLVQVSPTAQALGLHPAYRPTMMNHGPSSRSSKVAAALGHFSFFLGWIFGPLFMYMIASKGGYAKREAAKAFNFQVISLLAMVTMGIFTSEWLESLQWVMGPMAIGWFVLTIIGGVKASQGEDWTNPVRKVIKWEPLKEK